MRLLRLSIVRRSARVLDLLGLRFFLGDGLRHVDETYSCSGLEQIV